MTNITSLTHSLLFILLIISIEFVPLCKAQTYIMVNLQKSWSEAETYCINEYGTHLASIHSKSENTEAFELCANNRPSTSTSAFVGCWIGYNDLAVTGTYIWSDSSSVNFVNWRDGAPNKIDDHCSFIKVNLQDSEWEDTSCSLWETITRFLCAAPDTTTTTTTTTTTSTTKKDITLFESGDITLLFKGYNMFKDELSGSRILHPQFAINNTEFYSPSGSSCSYSSLQFTSTYSSYQAYATSDSESIAIGFNAIKYAAGGSLSRARSETRSHSLDTQSLIYSMDLQCAVSEASIVGFDKIIWNDDFVNAFRTLPESYDSDTDLEEYIDFWNDYGTHIILTAKFGGSILGTVIADKCTIIKTFGESMQYKSCLNAAYKGIGGAACAEYDDSSSISETVSNAIKNRRIMVKGGNTAQFTNIFNSFSDKTNDFQEWIDELVDLPYIIGGNVNEIHDVIQKTIELGNHQLNKHLSNSINDTTFLLIANALEEAYNDYALELSEDLTFDDDECLISCNDGNLITSQCICSNCVNSCCLVDTAVRVKVYHVFTLYFYIIINNLFP